MGNVINLLKTNIYLCVSLIMVNTAVIVLASQLIPGTPFENGEYLSPEVLESLNNHHKLNLSIIGKYTYYIKSIFTGDLPYSVSHEHLSLYKIILNAFPISAKIAILSLTISFTLGMIFGFISVISHSVVESTIVVITTLFLSTPSFISGIFLKEIFNPSPPIMQDYLPISSLILPAITLSIIPTSTITRLVYSHTRKVLQREDIIFVISKGVPTLQIWRRHILRNIIPPLVSYLTPLMTHMLAGIFVVEKIFGIPGLGEWLISSIMDRDYNLIVGLTTFHIFILAMINLITELLKKNLVPRVHE